MVLLTIAFLVVLSFIGGLSVYAYHASSLPSPQDLYQLAASFKTTRIYDRHGKLLTEVFDPQQGKRTMVRYGDIPQVVKDAVVSTEDATFFTNLDWFGWNPVAIARAIYQNMRQQEVVFGGSTITQQLVKIVYLSSERTLSRKVKEAILATEITRRYSKEEILEVYLNEVYFGNLAYGVETAAETYFGKHASELNLSEAALLAGMLQAPVTYDPYTDPEAARARRTTVLRLMQKHGYLTQAEVDAAGRQPLGVIPRQVVAEREAPHMVVAVQEELIQLYGKEMLFKGGFQVYTTLDLDMQHLAEQVAREKMAELNKHGASNAALVALDPQTGDVLAMLGSADFYDAAIHGQVNVALRPRQPGSSIKPFTYLAAMERGWTAATLLMDVAQQFPDGANAPYKPTNYDGKEYGPVSVRTALACSRNIPAVSTLHQIGVPALLEVAKRVGISSLEEDPAGNPKQYGLALALGSGEVKLLEMAGAYGALANGGQRVTPRLILHIEDQDGRVIMAETKPEMPQVMDPRHAHILTDILADDEARAPSFGRNGPLKLTFPAAAKTGTTNDYRDSWTIGYTPHLVTGVWVGNNDNRPMDRVSGARGAAIVWHDFMERALAKEPKEPFVRPDKIVEAEVCPVSGQKRGDLCPPGRKELFLAENAPKDKCSVHVRVAICKDSGKLATSACPKESVEEKRFQDYGPAWDTWAAQHKISPPPRETCPVHPVPVHVTLEAPDGALSGVVEVRGTTEIGDFGHYVVEYGLGSSPKKWERITAEIKNPVPNGVLCRWDTRKLREGTYTLRVLVYDRQGRGYEAQGVVTLGMVTATPQATVTEMPTASPKVSPTAEDATLTPEPTATLPPTKLPPSVVPSSTPQPTRTLGATRTPPPTGPATVAPSATRTASPRATKAATPTPTLTRKPIVL